ncbi:MAG: dihydrolipoyllysine-residue acetyltransferase [Thermochromatium sp.]
MSRLEEIFLPDIGDVSGAEIIEILVAPGDRIQPEQSLLTLESDKATIEIPSPIGGIVRELLVKTGDRVSRGDRLLRVERIASSAEDAPATPTQPQQPQVPEAIARHPLPDTVPTIASEPPHEAPGASEWRRPPILPRPEDMVAIARRRKAHASPAVRRMARELGVDLARVKGSGPKGRILKEDIQGYVRQTLAQGRDAAEAGAAAPGQPPRTPEIDFSRFGPIEIQELSRIRKLSGRHLHRCWTSIPHVTQFDLADITELDAFRQAQKESAAKAGVRLTLLPFLLKAVAVALARMPILKAALTPDGEHLVYRHYTHIGVAVDTPSGLVVPVVRDVDHKGLYQLATELAELSAKARDGRLLPGDMQGGCFSISSLGGIGGTAFTPIVNAPEVAILGVSRAEMRPVWNGHEFVPRLMLPLSLSYDHRVVDGADGARFTSLLGELLGDIRRLLI